MSTGVEALRSVARREHVHYDVEPELNVLRDGTRTRSGLLVWLWGIHAKGAGALPACAKSRKLAAQLTAIAAYALAGEISSCAELQPVRWALYASRVVPDADEIAVVVRIAQRTPAPRSDGVLTEEHCLRRVRSRLRELGIPEL